MIQTTKKPLVLYGTVYGSAKTYASYYASLHGYTIQDIHGYYDLTNVSILYLFVSIYAFNLFGLKSILNKMDSTIPFVVITIGLSDPKDPLTIENRNNMVKTICKSKTPHKIIHLRGGIDYAILSMKHKAMMKLLYVITKKKNVLTNEDQAFLDTYGSTISFIDFSTLDLIDR